MRLHFIAIGGSIMHQLAIALHFKGYDISGSDDEIFDPAKRNLMDHNLLPDQFGWDVSKITTELDGIILGMHARKDNPELIKAQEMNLPIYSFPEFVFNQSQNKLRVAIAGSHGKTSITSMIMHVMKYFDQDFDYLVGAQLEGFEQVVKVTEHAPTIILEGDEYLSSPLDLRPKIHWYQPHIAVISGIAWDHINVFPTEEDYIDQFRQFLNLLPEHAKVFYYENDEILMRLMQEEHLQSTISCIPYQSINYEIIDSTYHLLCDGLKIPVQPIGRHNMENLEAARLICNELSITDDQFYEAISSFRGAAKRMEVLHQSDNQLIIRDFAHAPSKLKATIAAVRENYPSRLLVAMMELHTFSSLDPVFLTQYQDSMIQADHAVLFVDSHALELKKKDPIQDDTLIEAFNQSDLTILRTKKELEDYLVAFRGKEKSLLFMSSGNFNGFDFEPIVSII